MSQQPIRILLVEDSLEDAQILQDAFAEAEDLPVVFQRVDRLSTALQALDTGGVDVVLLDLQLPDSEGLETLVTMHRRAPDVPIVVLTASDDEALAAQAAQRGAQDYLVKGYVQVYPSLLWRAMRYAIERKRGELAVYRAHAQTERFLASITSILIGVDADGRVTHWNRVAEETFDLLTTTVLSRPLAGIGIRWDTAKITECIAHCRQTDQAMRLDDVPFTRPDGQDGYLGITIIPIRGDAGESSGALIFGADVTERKLAEAERARLQGELHDAQKMESIGRFAGGIAHDFDNFLQVILGFAWLIRSRHRDDQELISDLQEIVHAAESGSGMVRQLLAFSRRKPAQPTVFDLNDAVQHMVRLVQQFVGESIHIELTLGAGPFPVKLDSTGLEQIVMNLSSNARDAMPQGGTLTIATAHVTLDDAFAAAHPWARAGDYVRLSVKDSGMGMDPEVASHIFEPFFTTKQVSRGTGLGLAVVYGLVRQHEGLVDIETAPEQGTMFHLYFPRQERVPDAADAGAASPAKPPGTEFILIVEHNERQRTLDEEILRESGYEVAALGDGTQALELFTQQAGRIDAILLDTAVPNLNCRAMVEQLRAVRPQTKVLLVSSYLDQQARAVEGSQQGVQVLMRPYVPAQLLDRVRQLLDAPLAAEGPVASTAGQHRILVVDDEASVRALCERILKERYDVITASSGRQALERLGQGSFHLLLTDIKMPEMDGFALIEQALKRRPNLKILAMSGMLTDEMEQRLRAPAFRSEVIRKPFSAPQLQDVISRCLNSAGVASAD